MALRSVSELGWRGISARSGSVSVIASQVSGRVRLEVMKSSVVHLPCAPSSVAVARRRLIEDMLEAGIFDTAIGDAALVITELLSNAIRHARPLPGARLRVTWVLAGGSIEVAVSDGGGPTRPHAAYASLSALGGRGLGIVEHISYTWGVRDDDVGLTVWAVLPAPDENGNGYAARSP